MKTARKLGPNRQSDRGPPAGGIRVATCLRRWRALPLRSFTLDPGKGQMNILLLVDTTIEGAILPTHARNNDTWVRRRIVNNM